MPLAAYTTDIESVPEAIRDEYIKDGEGYKLNVQESNGYVLENVEALKSALNKERKSRSEYEKQLSAYRSKMEGFDIDSAKEAMERLKELEQFDPKSEAEKLALEKFEAQKKRLETQIAKQYEAKIQNEYEPYKAKYEKMDAQLRRELINNTALAAIASENGDAELLLPHVVGKMKMVINDDGEYESVFVDSKGEVMYDNKGAPLQARNYVASLKERFPAAFKVDVKSGSGAKDSKASAKSSEITFSEFLRSAPANSRII